MNEQKAQPGLLMLAAEQNVGERTSTNEFWLISKNVGAALTTS
jgi:hypothetical protein